jgi:hypothetical protein
MGVIPLDRGFVKRASPTFPVTLCPTVACNHRSDAPQPRAACPPNWLTQSSPAPARDSRASSSTNIGEVVSQEQQQQVVTCVAPCPSGWEGVSATGQKSSSSQPRGPPTQAVTKAAAAAEGQQVAGGGGAGGAPGDPNGAVSRHGWAGATASPGSVEVAARVGDYRGSGAGMCVRRGCGTQLERSGALCYW